MKTLKPRRDGGTNPFPGLRPFRTDEHHLFFGREEQTIALLGLLREHRFLAVVGTSGSGKSSLVRAGLIPALHRGTMAQAGSTWEVVLLRPGGHPITNLARALVDADLYDPEDPETLPRLRATLSRSRFGLIEAVKQSEDIGPGGNLLVVVDQFEELFRFRQQGTESEETAAAFVNLLLAASESETERIYVAITMRSDYLGDCSEIPRLAEAVNRSEYLIPRLLRDQKRDAIEKPVGVGGAQIAPRLVQRMLNQVGDDADQLPVLQHALMRTWDVWAADHAEGEPLDLRHFDATGGMDEALSRHADEVFAALPGDEHRDACERVFKALTEKGADNRGIRRPARLGALERIAGVDRAVVATVLDAFRGPGVTFIMPGIDREIEERTVLDLSHESLMRVWRRLRGWVEEEAQSARIYRRLAETAELWRDGKAGLFRDPDLQIASSWREASRPNEHWAGQYGGRFAVASEFLDRSREAAQREEHARETARRRELEQARALAEAEQHRARERERSARRFKALALGIALVALAALVAFFQGRVARQDADRNAGIAAQKAEEARASAVLAARNEQAALEAAAELERVLVRSDFNQGVQSVEAGNAAEGLAFLVRSMRMDPDYWPAGARAMSTLASGRFRVREYPVIEQDRPITDHWVNRAEDLVLTSDQDLVEEPETPELFVFDLRTGERLYRVAGGAKVFHARWSPGGARLYAVGADEKTLRAWEARSGAEVWHHECEGSIDDFAFVLGDHPTLGELVSVRHDRGGEVQVFSTKSGEAVGPRWAHPEAPCMSHGFSPDGSLHWAWHSNGVITVRETGDGRVLLETPGRQWSWTAWITPDNGALVARGERGRAVGFWPLPPVGRGRDDAGPSAGDRADAAGRGWIDYQGDADARLLPSGRRVAIFVRDDAQRRLHADVHDLATGEKTASFDVASGSPGGSPGRHIVWRYLAHEAPREFILRFPLVAVIEEVAQNSVAIWDLESGTEIQRIRTPWFLRDVEIAPEGMRIATVSVDGQVMLWDIFGGTMRLPEAIEHEGMVTLAFSPDGSLLLTSVWPAEAVEFRSSQSGERLFEPLRGRHFNRGGAVFSSRGDRVALYSSVRTSSLTLDSRQTEGRFLVADTALRPIVFEPLLPAGGGAAGLAAWTAAGAHIVVAGRERATEPGQLLVFDAAERERQRSVSLPDGVVAFDLELTPDGRLALLLASDERVHVVEVESGTVTRELVLDGEGSALAVSADGRRVAAGTTTGKVRVFDLATGAPLGAALAHGTTRINVVRFSADGTLLASGSEDFTVRVVDAASGAETMPPQKLDNVLLDISFLDGGTEALLVPFAASLPIVELSSGRVVRRLEHAQPCLVAASSPGGEVLATAGGTSNNAPSGAVHLWHGPSGRRIGAPLAHKGQVQKLAFSRDGTLLASGTAGPRLGAVEVWDVASGRPLTDPVRGGGPVSSLSFDPAGTSVVAGWRDGSVRVIDLPPRSTPLPAWLPLLAESVTGARLEAGRHSVEELTAAERQRARESVEAALDGAGEDDAHARWARWFLSDPATRTISPLSRTSVASYVRRKSMSASMEDVAESLRLSPAEGVTTARIALSLLDLTPGEDRVSAALRRHWRDVALAFADRAVELEPRSSEVWVLRAELLERLGRRDEARQAIARARELETSASPNVRYLSALSLAQEGKWDEAGAAFEEAIETVVAQAASKDPRSASAPLVGLLSALEPAQAGVDVLDVRLPEPIPGTFEDFDRVAEGSVPAGWSCAAQAFGVFPPDAAATMREFSGEASPDWIVLDFDRHPTRDVTVRGEPGRIDGRVPATLVDGRFLHAAPRAGGCGRPERSIETPDFDLGGRGDVHVAFHSAYQQSEGSIAALEYSVDGGATWLAVAYLIDARDLLYDAEGGIDAVATLTAERDGLPWFIDEAGELRGRSYVDFIRAAVRPELAGAIDARRANDARDSRRIEVFRLPAADGARRVRLRFALAGTPGGHAWGIDRFGLHEIPGGKWAERPERLDVSADPAVLAGIGLGALRGRRAPSVLAAALSPRDLEDVSPADPDLGRASWIWSARESASDEVAFFRRSFDVDGAVRAAHILAVCDDRFEAYLNGERVLAGSDSTRLNASPVTRVVRPGRNVLAVRAANVSDAAGLLLRLEVSLAGGETRDIATDDSWRVARDAAGDWTAAAFDDAAWPTAYVHGPYGVGPWGRRFDSGTASDEERSAAGLLLDRAARLAPDDPWVQIAAAYVAAGSGTGRLEEAFARAGRSLAIRPRGPAAARVLSALWVARGDELKRSGAGDAAAVAYEIAHVLFDAVAERADTGILARLAGAGLAAENRMLIPRGATWRYLDDGPYPDDAWKGIDYDDASWRQGPASLGYGDTHVRTTVRWGPNARDRRVTTHFRAAFDLADPGAYAQLVLRLQRDDGVVIHLNGQEVARDGMPAGTIGPATLAAQTVGGVGETEFVEIDLFTPPLRAGRNVIAAEVHQATPSSSDLGFDLEVEAVGTIGGTLPDLAKLALLEEDLGVPDDLREALWVARARRLRAAGELDRAAEALERARRLSPQSPAVLEEAAIQHAIRGDDDAAYASFREAARRAIAIKEGPSLAARLFLPASLAEAIEPLIAPSALGLADAARRLVEAKTPHSARQAEWLLRWAAELASDHEGRLAVAAVWPALDAAKALDLAEAALAERTAPPESPRAIRERRDWIRLRERALRDLGRTDEAEELLRQLLLPPPRPAGLDDALVDLSAHYTHGLQDGRWHYGVNPETNLRLLAETYRPRRGVEFDLRGLIQLNSGVYTGETAYPVNRGKDINEFADRSFPDEVRGIQVGLRATELHFLASTVWGQAAVGDVVARLVVHYGDGTTAEVPLRFAQDIDDWAPLHGELDREHVAWIGRVSPGAVRHLTISTWRNPAPAKTIATLDFVSEKRNAAPFLVAVTASEAP